MMVEVLCVLQRCIIYLDHDKLNTRTVSDPFRRLSSSPITTTDNFIEVYAWAFSTKVELTLLRK